MHWESHWGALLSSPRFRALKISTRSSSGARSMGSFPSCSDKIMYHMPHTVQQLKELQRRNLQTSQDSTKAVLGNAKVLRWLSSWEVFGKSSITDSTIYPGLNGQHSTDSEGEVHLVTTDIIMLHTSHMTYGDRCARGSLLLDIWWIMQLGADTTGSSDSYLLCMLPKGTVSITGSSRPQWLDVNAQLHSFLAHQ